MHKVKFGVTGTFTGNSSLKVDKTEFFQHHIKNDKYIKCVLPVLSWTSHSHRFMLITSNTADSLLINF